jgi:hypothetical protein
VADGGTVAPPPGTSCPAQALLTRLGRPARLLVGGDLEDTVAGQAGWDVRYKYLAGGLFPGATPPSSCADGKAAAWWGCWQDTALPPGQYVRDFLAKTAARGQLPMLTYYELLQGSGLPEGTAQVAAIADAAFLTRYLNDWRFLLQQVGSAPALLHIEPDFWGYAQQLNASPSAIPAAVTAANPTDCGGLENSVRGLARCMIAMVRRYAPNARVGLHASGWATKVDVLKNTDPALDVAGEGRRLGDFLRALGAGDGDFLAVDASDRDAGYYESIGRRTWWDASDATLPSFTQAFRWSRAVADAVGLPVLWWQVPVGHMALPNVSTQWRDNRVDYFFAHPDGVSRSGAFGMVFGAGARGQTTPSTDSGNLTRRASDYLAAGGQPPCL